MTSIDRKDLFHISIVLVIAVATRIYKLGYASVWLDEVATIKISSNPLSTLWVTAYDPTPPLYYSVIHWVLNFGHSEFFLRLPSFAFGVLTVAIIYIATRKIGGSLAAFAASLLLALSFHNIEYSQEARAYALLSLCVSVSFLGLANLYSRWTNTSSGFTFLEFLKCGGGLYGLGLIGALYTHNTAAFYWIGVQFFFLAWWIRPFAFSRSCLGYWFAINLCVLLLWLPWLFASLEVIERGRFSWLQLYDPERAFVVWRGVHGMPSSLLGQPYVDIAILTLGLIGLHSLRRHYAVIGLLVGLLVSSSVVIWAYGLLATPVYMLRTILWGSLFSAVLVGIGAAALPTRVGYGVTLLIFLAGAGGAFDYYDKNRAENESWRSAASLFKEMQRPNDILLFRTDYISMPFFYYIDDYSTDWKVVGWNCRKEYARSGQIEQGEQIMRVNWSDSDISADNPIAKIPDASLWVVESHCHPHNWAGADALFHPNWRLQKTYKFRGVFVHRMKSA